MALADAAGLNRDRLAQDMGSPAVEGALARNAELANALGIHGTPSYVVGDTLVPGAIEPAAMRKLIASRREAMRAEQKPTAVRE
jgi:protein-disulfide isomerase